MHSPATPLLSKEGSASSVPACVVLGLRCPNCDGLGTRSFGVGAISKKKAPLARGFFDCWTVPDYGRLQVAELVLQVIVALPGRRAAEVPSDGLSAHARAVKVGKLMLLTFADTHEFIKALASARQAALAERTR